MMNLQGKQFKRALRVQLLFNIGERADSSVPNPRDWMSDSLHLLWIVKFALML